MNTGNSRGSGSTTHLPKLKSKRLVESTCRRRCPPRDEDLIAIGPCTTAQATHAAENARLNGSPVVWNGACILMSRVPANRLPSVIEKPRKNLCRLFD